VLLRNPTTGIVGCCARAASGHAAIEPLAARTPFEHIRKRADKLTFAAFRRLAGPQAFENESLYAAALFHLLQMFSRASFSDVFIGLDGQSLLHAVQFVARRWEQRGWLHRFRDGSGLEWWELTPSGRSALKLLPARAASVIERKIGGRQKGTPNKISALLKDQLVSAMSLAGEVRACISNQ
jgi:hypothetical protein